MPGVFELKQTDTGQFMFNLRARVRANAPLDARYERRTANPGEPYFVLKAGGGEALGRSELHSSGQALENGIASVQRNAPDAHIRDLSVGLAGAR
jgi:uncharacterized protein YegP (UPF0339 family)